MTYHTRRRYCLRSAFRLGQNHKPLRAYLTLVGILVFSHFATRSSASDAASQAGSTYAVLVGIEKYQRVTPLRFTVRDVQLLTETLVKRGGVPAANIRQIVDDADSSQPLRATIESELPAWFAKATPNDRLVIYFSGHGFRDASGRLYLAPMDFDAQSPETTGISAQWLREQLAACPAQFKLLVLDACHAGSEKGDDDITASPAKNLGEVFRDLSGVVTMASSTEDEKSQIWPEKQQSLFSYWLNQGLKGHADVDADSSVSIDELYEYVHRNVTHSSKVLFSRSQTPVRIVRTGTVGVPTVVQIQPQSLNLVLGDIAEELAWALTERKVAKVGVLEFTNETQLGELLGADFGLLGRYCATSLEQRLNQQAANHFSVVNRRVLQTALKAQKFSLDDLGSPEALRKLSTSAGGMPVVALGTLRNRSGRILHLHCDLIQTEGNVLAGTAGGVAVLSESEWAMIGRSVQVKPEDRRTPIDPVTTTDKTEAERTATNRVVEKLDQRSQGAHPLLDPAFPYQVTIMVAGKPRAFSFRGNECFVALRKGEVYEIWVENKSERVVLLRALVDGLNTLPQKETTKGVVSYQVAAPVSLDEARFWILDPRLSATHAIRGFVTETGNAGKVREFTVVDAAESLAARQEFTEQLGMITLAFYAPSGSARGIGTAAGTERDEKLEEVAGYKTGNLLGVIHIRYVEPTAMEQPAADRPASHPPDDSTGSVLEITAPDTATVSVDGRDYGTQRRLSFSGLQPGRDYLSQIRVRFTDGTEARRVITVTAGRSTHLSIMAPTHVVFEHFSEDDLLSRLMIADGDGQSARPLVDGMGSESSPALSPDGSQVAFEQQDDSETRDCYISVADIRGGTVRRVSDQPRRQRRPVWSPTGQHIAFSGYDPGGQRESIYVAPVTGGGATRLAEGSQPSWAPDGQSLLYTYRRELEGTAEASHFPNELQSIRIDGGQPVNISDGCLGSWSPNGNQIAFLRYSLGPDSTIRTAFRQPQLMVCNPDGSGARPLADADSYRWDPTGMHLAFSRLGELLVVQPDGKNMRVVVGAPSEEDRFDSIYQIAWSPDGQQLALVREDPDGFFYGFGNLFAVNIEGRNFRQLTNYDGSIQSIDWR